MTDGRTSCPLADHLATIVDRPRADFRREDMLHVIESRHIERITFHYTGLDGRLKELRLPVTDRGQAEAILAEGERVDGSSLFRGLVDTGRSDLYVVPMYRSAFLNPFDEGSLDLVCRFLTRDGELTPFAPDTILGQATRRFEARTGLQLRALGELEFFLLGGRFSRCYAAEPQRGYHESAPFLKGGEILNEMAGALARITGAVKYAHAEVGVIESLQSDSEEIRGAQAEQMEIEFLPRPVEEMADDLVLGRWLIRNVAFRHGCIATFAPKLEEGSAGNGLHFHMELLRNGTNVMLGPDGHLSENARALVGGLCEYADSLTAFGNTVSSAYLRLTPNHEAPTRICWSDHNRSAMIRVPLGWSNLSDLCRKVNPGEPVQREKPPCRQTVELRSPDGSANIHLVLAGIVMAAEWAFQGTPSRFHGAGPLRLAERLYVQGDIQADPETLSRLPPLPTSCVESGRLLLEKRELYERDHVFPPAVIDHVAQVLEEENDETLLQRLADLPPDDRSREARRVMHSHLHKP